MKIIFAIVSCFLLFLGCSPEKSSKTTQTTKSTPEKSNPEAAPTTKPVLAPKPSAPETVGTKKSGEKLKEENKLDMDDTAESPSSPKPSKIKTRTSGHKNDMQATEDIE